MERVTWKVKGLKERKISNVGWYGAYHIFVLQVQTDDSLVFVATGDPQPTGRNGKIHSKKPGHWEAYLCGTWIRAVQVY